MSTKYLVIGLGLALVVLVALSRCGSSEAPVKVDAEPKKTVAGSFTATQKTPAAANPATTSPEQSAPVVVAPRAPGSADFGPSPLPPGGAEQGDAEWVKQYKEAAAKQAAAQAQPAAPPSDQKNNH